MASDLDRKIIKQIEYYFGDINLPKDKFMQEKINEDDGWITLETLLTFNRLNSLSSDAEVIASAVEKSDGKLVVVSEDRKKLRRNPDNPLPEMNDERKKELFARSAYAKGFSLDAEFDDIMSFLEAYGPIESFTKRSKLDAVTKTHIFKGSCFIIFKDVETCKKFIETEGIKYKDVELIRKWRNDYFEEKKKQNQERLKERKAQKEPEVETKKIDFPKGAVLFFDGIKENETLTREEIKEQMKEVGKIEPSFMDFQKGDASGYIRLKEENSAVEFLKKLTDGELKVGSVVLKLRVLEGEEEEKYLQKASESMKKKFQQQNFKGRGRKRKGRFFESGPRNKAKS